MMRIVYSTLAYALLPIALMRLFIKSIKQPLYRKRWWERLGYVKPLQGKYAWLHAVSLGEVNAALPLIRDCQTKYPAVRWIITTGTATGYARVQSELGNTVEHFNAPYDCPGIIKRFLKRCQPTLLIIMETELWPNLIHYTKQQHIPIFLANARLSERSARRYNRFAKSSAAMLNQITMIAAQYQQDALRFIALGINPLQVMVGGNLKFNQALPDGIEDTAKERKKQLGESRPIWMAASTAKGEDAMIIEAFQKCRGFAPQLLLVLAPRHPERCHKIARMLDKANIPFVKHSELPKSLDADTQCVLVDSIGELLPYYHVATMAFIGGSLVPKGGQNPLEAAALHTALITGPHMRNFASIHHMFVNANACTVAHNANELAERVIHLLENPEECDTMAAMGAALFEDNKQALEKHITWVGEVLGGD